MGAKNSKNTSRRNSDDHEIMVQRALEQQRHMYEQRYSELIDNQIRINEEINRQNTNSVNRNVSPEVTTVNNLYPNLQTVSNNNLQTNSSNAPSMSQPSTSFMRPQSIPVANPTLPSAPSAPTNIMDNEGALSNGARPKQRKPTQTRAQKQKQQNTLVKCVTCNNDYGSQIYQCHDGHSSCDKCRFLSKRCGLCSKLITDMRNITLEGTIGVVTNNTNYKYTDKNHGALKKERIKCRNANDGCCLSFTLNEMEKHLTECPFRELECPLTSVFQNCSWHGKINQIQDHFKDKHPQNCIADVDKEMDLNINENQRIVYLVNMGPFNFLINIKVKLNDKLIFMTAQLLGTKVSALKWTYELHVFNKREPRRKFLYSDVCHSNATSVVEIFNNFQCASMTTDHAKTFLNNGTVTYKFFLKKNNDVNKK